MGCLSAIRMAHLLLSSICVMWVVVFSVSGLGLGLGMRPSVLTFDEGYTRVFGDSNLMLLRDGKTVHLSLDERTGAGFASQDLYLHGLFSASIKLPADYAAGVVVAFYMSNGDMFENTHDEIDFEFLGNIRGKEWRIQTNVYGNGSTGIGREERYSMWFDPTEDFHNYAILWTKNRIVFSIDDIPIREVTRKRGMEESFPEKPMSLYATIWDGSGWATNGGRYRINYKLAPYVAEFANLVLHGCVVDPTDHSSTCHDDKDGESRSFADFTLSTGKRSAMEKFRKGYTTYTYCYARQRYRTALSECRSDRAMVKNLHGVRFDKLGYRRPHSKHHYKSAATSRKNRQIGSAKL
ncbi:xyloglucan endotransglycosylase, family GH16 [Zostera marina]|uniref:Xyloglucan endotransglucosylase/hydrolase n=1 Tax=Zostera marina TaxID=29655 RepID=A0A0K9PL08_ZOSMR|nr:xyloglucan endotransglycosylase, family GH16 [Zostera marina]